MGWDAERYALAALVNEMRAGNHLTLLINRDPKKSTKPKPPEMFPIPDENKKSQAAPKPGSFAAMIVAAKAAQRKRMEQESAKQRRRRSRPNISQGQP